MIPVCEPVYGGREKELLIDCIDSGWISHEGSYVKEFEEGFSNYLNCDYGISVSNGTVSLETALFAAKIESGDEVIMPSFTIISCAIATIRVGAVPVFVDVDPDTWCIDVNEIEENITTRTRAIMAVHMYGHPADMDPIIDLAKKYNLIVIEDAAQVHGAEYKSKKCGSIGHLGCFSFYANKILNTGEGGMVVTSDKEMAERAKSYRNLCFRQERRFYHTELGNNYRMTNIQAAIGVAQLEKLDEYVEIKRELGTYYKKGLSQIDGIKTQVEKPWAKMVYWMYCIVIDEKLNISAEKIIEELDNNAIGARPYFLGLHEQPIMLKLGFSKKEIKLPVTEKISKQGLYLPSGVSLTNNQIDRIIDKLSVIIQNNL